MHKSTSDRTSCSIFRNKFPTKILPRRVCTTRWYESETSDCCLDLTSTDYLPWHKIPCQAWSQCGCEMLWSLAVFCCSSFVLVTYDIPIGPVSGPITSFRFWLNLSFWVSLTFCWTSFLIFCDPFLRNSNLRQQFGRFLTLLIEVT